MNELVYQKKEGCKDAYSKEKVKIKKAKIVWLKKMKFLFALKLSLNVGQFYPKFW